MNPRTQSLLRSLGVNPTEETREADPVLSELLGKIEPLLREAIAKGAAPAAPMGARAASFLRSMQPYIPVIAPYTAPLQPRKSNLLPATTKAYRNQEGRIVKGETTYADGTIMTTVPRRDDLGRILSAVHEYRGKKFTTKVQRDSFGRIASTSIVMDGAYETGQEAVCDTDVSMVNLLARAVENAAPADLSFEASYAPGRSPLTRAYIQRDSTGKPVFVNCGNQQFPVGQNYSRPTSATIQCGLTGRPEFVVINRWKMLVTFDALDRVQSLEPLNEGVTP